MHLLPLLPLTALLASASAQQMQLARNYSGSAFFDLWNYKVGDDVTNYWGEPSNMGVVNFTDQAYGMSQNLLFVNSVGNVIVRTDNFTDGTGNSSYIRNSVQLLSKDQITPGSLVIMDAIHLPFGCAVWPAFWMSGGANWPTRGEVDLIENVNLATNNAYSLHTSQGCQASKQTPMTGNLVQTDCYNATAFDTGCKVVDSDLSYGSGFANNGGGAFAFLWNDAGMKIWFFPRPSVPADLSTATPNPGGWGTPTAFYPIETCDFTKFFGPQTMILEIDVCGNFAVDVWTDTCSAVAGKCTDVVPIASTFDDAYFEIKYITVFSNSTTLTAIAPSSVSSAAGASGTAASGTDTNGTTTVSSAGGSGKPASSSSRVFAPVTVASLIAGFLGLLAISL